MPAFPATLPWRAALTSALLVVSSLTAGDLSSHATRSQHATPDPGRNVLLVTLDTTRADHIGAYGARSTQTPTLDRLAREGLLMTRAEAVAPLTLPAHYSIMTGRLPGEHGVQDNAVPARPRVPTLAGLLGGHGYATGAFVASMVLDARWGLDEGFQTYDGRFQAGISPARNRLRRDADEVTDLALGWLGRTSSPFFLWLHYYDAHAPYDGGHAALNGYAGYGGALTYMDTQLGRVLDALDARGELDRTVIVVIGDHGESLGEHGERTHGLFLYESVTHIPFIVRAPERAVGGIRIVDPASSTDVLPTILDLLGIDRPRGLSGRSVVARRGAADHLLAAYSETMYPRYHFGWSELRAINDGRFKFIDAPKPELYDLARDPGERQNLYSDRPALAAVLSRRLLEIQGETSPASARDAPADSKAALAALGYISGNAATRQSVSALPDPKDKIDLYNLITNGPRHRLSRLQLITNPASSGAHGGLP